MTTNVKTKKPKTRVQWRYPYATGNDPTKPGKQAGEKKKPQKARPKKYQTKRMKTAVRANLGYELHPDCDGVFANRVHAFRFRIAMMSTRARDLISVFDQLEIANRVEAEIDALELKLGRSVPSDVVAQLVDAMVMDLERAA